MNCISCYGERNNQSYYRKLFPKYKKLYIKDIEDICKNIINIKMEKINTINRLDYKLLKNKLEGIFKLENNVKGLKEDLIKFVGSNKYNTFDGIHNLVQIMEENYLKKTEMEENAKKQLHNIQREKNHYSKIQEILDKKEHNIIQNLKSCITSIEEISLNLSPMEDVD